MGSGKALASSQYQASPGFSRGLRGTQRNRLNQSVPSLMAGRVLHRKHQYGEWNSLGQGSQTACGKIEYLFHGLDDIIACTDRNEHPE